MSKKAGIIVGAIIGAIVLAVVLFILWRRWKMRKTGGDVEETPAEETPAEKVSRTGRQRTGSAIGDADPRTRTTRRPAPRRRWAPTARPPPRGTSPRTCRPRRRTCPLRRGMTRLPRVSSRSRSRVRPTHRPPTPWAPR
jgi:hypothetical protein